MPPGSFLVRYALFIAVSLEGSLLEYVTKNFNFQESGGSFEDGWTLILRLRFNSLTL